MFYHFLIMKLYVKSYLRVLIFLGIVCMFTRSSFGQALFSGITVLENKEGVSVFSIKSGTPLKDAGVRKDDVILEIEGEKIKTIDDYVKISKELKNKKNEAKVIIKRKDKIYTIIIDNYSEPIKEFWSEKVILPSENLPSSKDNFDYWFKQGKIELDSLNGNMSYPGKVDIYNKAINYLYNALHHKPEVVQAMVLIADAYSKIGEVSMKEGLKKEANENFAISIRLYGKIMQKDETQKDGLIEIRDNLKNIENILKQN